MNAPLGQDQLLKRVGSAILSKSGGAMFIGVLGILSGISGLFIDLDSTVSVRWLLAYLLITGTVIVVLLNLVAARPTIIEKPIPFDEVPISVHDENLLMIRRNPYLANLIVVAGYQSAGEYERLAFVGTVEHIQDRAVQVRVGPTYNGFVPAAHYRDVVVRPVVPREFMMELIQASSTPQAPAGDAERGQEIA